MIEGYSTKNSFFFLKVIFSNCYNSTLLHCYSNYISTSISLFHSEVPPNSNSKSESEVAIESG